MNPIAASVLPSALHGFFTDHLPRQRAMSPHTLHSYRDSLKLLLRFVAGKKHDHSTLTVEQLTVNQILDFLEYLESGRRNKACTRNVRLTAIHSFFRCNSSAPTPPVAGATAPEVPGGGNGRPR